MSNNFYKIGIAAILIIAVTFFYYSCNKNNEVNYLSTIIKTDTIHTTERIYIYGKGNAKKVNRVVDTLRLVDTMVIYSDPNLLLSISDLDSSRPKIEYRITNDMKKEIVTITKAKNNYIALGAFAGAGAAGPSITYGTRKANYYLSYDLINKTPMFGISVNLSTFAGLDHRNRNSTGLKE